jgi:putative oxidoreductase
MNTLIAFFQLRFIPRNVNVALFVLRVWLGLSMFLLHALTKLKGFSELSGGFPDPLGVGHKWSLIFALGGEALGSVLLVLGLFTRFAALSLIATMGVAFFLVHKGVLTGEKSGELAFIYLAGYVTLFFTGAGAFSLDTGFREQPLNTKSAK